MLRSKHATSSARASFGHVERPEDALTVFDGQRHDSSPESERLLKQGASRLVNEPYEFADIVVRDVQAREVQRSEPTRLVGDD